LTDLRLPQCEPLTLTVDLPFPPTILYLSGAGLQAYLRLNEFGRPSQLSFLRLRT